jgi:CBS domain-containing protein
MKSAHHHRDFMGTPGMADGAAPNVTRVSTNMSAPAVVASPDTDVLEAGRLMVRYDVRHLPVVAAGQLMGMVSARDLLIVEWWPGEPLRPPVPR